MFHPLASVESVLRSLFKSVTFHPSLTVIRLRDKCMAITPPKPYCHIQIRNKCMAITPPKPYCHIQIRDKCMAVSPPKPYCNTFVSSFRGFQLSAIPPVLGLLCWNLNMLLTWSAISRDGRQTCFGLWKFMLISSRSFWILIARCSSLSYTLLELIISILLRTIKAWN